jgi:hypothetical protein
LGIVAASVLIVVLVLMNKTTPKPPPTPEPTPETVQTGVAKDSVTINSVGTMNGQISSWTEDSSATALVVTNKSDTTLHLEAAFTYTSGSETVSEDTDYVQALAPGASTVLVGECSSSASSARYRITGDPSINQDPPRYSINGYYDLREVSRDANGVVVEIKNTSSVTIGVRTLTVLGTDDDGNTYVGTSWVDQSGNSQTTMLDAGDSASVSITTENLYGKDAGQSSSAPDWNDLQLEYCLEGYIE